MGLRSWLKARLGQSGSQQAPASSSINLVSSEEVPAQFAAPERAGIDLTMTPKAWSVARLEGLFRSAERQPTAQTLQAARQARHCLSAFWLTAPVDQLEELYAGALGELQRRQLEGPLPQQPLAGDEQQWRDGLVAYLQDPTYKVQRHNLLLALLPYCPPYSFKVENAIANLPRWLLRDYVVYCEPELKAELDGPAGLLEPAAEEEFVLSERRGEEAMEWFRNEEALTRMQALVNLYSLDPSDSETLAELAALRRVTAQLWLDVDASQLETLYQTPVGLLTRSLITSGFGSELLSEADQQARQLLAQRAGDLEAPCAVNALLAALLYYAPGQVQVADSSALPEWLVRELNTL